MPADHMDQLLKILDKLILPKNLVETIEDVQPEKKKEYYEEMAAVYTDGFRHRYSEISAFLEKKSPDTYASLEIWLKALIEYGESIASPVAIRIKKLEDHVELETIRLDRMKAVQLYGKESRRIKEEIEKLSQETIKTAQKTKNKVEKIQEQSISILSIFSAVVLAFMGGISFSSRILESMSEVSMFRLAVTILLLGFVLINTVFILLRVILWVSGTVHRIKDGMWALWITNGIMVGLLFLLIGAYATGFGASIENWGSSTYPQGANSASSVSVSSVPND